MEADRAAHFYDRPPVAHPVNMLVMAPANYKFADFVRTGWLLMLVSFFGLLAGMALFWHL